MTDLFALPAAPAASATAPWLTHASGASGTPGARGGCARGGVAEAEAAEGATALLLLPPEDGDGAAAAALTSIGLKTSVVARCGRPRSTSRFCGRTDTVSARAASADLLLCVSGELTTGRRRRQSGEGSNATAAALISYQSDDSGAGGRCRGEREIHRRGSVRESPEVEHQCKRRVRARGRRDLDDGCVTRTERGGPGCAGGAHRPTRGCAVGCELGCWVEETPAEDSLLFFRGGRRKRHGSEAAEDKRVCCALDRTGSVADGGAG